MKKLLLSVILVLGTYLSADFYADNLPPAHVEYKTYIPKPPPVLENPPRRETYKPSQTAPAPGVMYDYRVPTYDIYKFDLSPTN